MEFADSKDLEKNFRLITQKFLNSNFTKMRTFFYYFLVKNFQKENIFLESAENKLTSFGEEFIKNQKDLDRDIFEIMDINFSSLF